MKQLKKELYNILIYIVEPTIKPKDLRKILDTMIVPVIKKRKK